MRFIGGAVTGVLAVPALLVGWLAWMDRKSDHRHAMERAAREDAGYCGEYIAAQLTNPRAFPGRTAYAAPPRPAGVEHRVPRDRPAPWWRT